jgi:hypothetical protein
VLKLEPVSRLRTAQCWTYRIGRYCGVVLQVEIDKTRVEQRTIKDVPLYPYFSPNRLRRERGKARGYETGGLRPCGAPKAK